MSKTKKQHYLPRFYLKQFCIPGSEQIYVYDKENKRHRINNHYDVACENCYYDLDWSDALTRNFKDELKEFGITVEDLNKAQLIENGFAENVEITFSKLLKKILIKVKNITDWIENNCLIMTYEEKVILSKLISLQYARSSKMRNMMSEMTERINEMLEGMGASEDKLIDNSKMANRKRHVGFILSEDSDNELTKSILALDWTLYINRTPQKIITADFPFAHISHVKGTAMHPMNGIASVGIEIVFPLSPDVILCMYDGEYHIEMRKRYSMRYCSIDDENIIAYYNNCIKHSAERYVFSSVPF